MIVHPRPIESENNLPSIGRYRPLVKLGRGGMADVYLAVSRVEGAASIRRTRLERLVVIKRVRPDLVAGEDPEEISHFTGMFWDEAKLAMLLNHTNVVHTNDACEYKGALYLVMEYIEGQALNTLQRELSKRNTPLTQAQCAYIMSEVLSGLHYAHDLKTLEGEALNIVHRDVSPQNILLGYDGTIKLVDFGVAKAETRTEVTRAGTLKGKARYMAPEQIINKNVDRRADVYSAAVVLWELIARKKMVAGTNMLEQLATVLKTEPPRLIEVCPDVDPELDAIVHKALAREPDDRYHTALEMREALQSFYLKHGDVRASELGALVHETFKEEREKLSTDVRMRLLGLADEPARPLEQMSGSFQIPSDPFVALDMDHRSSPSILSLGGTPPPRSATGTSLTPLGVVQGVDQQPLPPPSTGKRTIAVLIGCLMVLLCIVGALFGVVISGSRARDAVAAAAPAQLPPPPTAIADNTPKVAPRPPEARPAEEPTATATATQTATATATGHKTTVISHGPSPKWQPAHPPAAAAPAKAAAAPAAAAPPDDRGGSEEPTAAAGSGYLTIDTYPWTKVSMNGRVLGNTPLVRVPVPAGTHTLVMENAQDGVRQTTTVNVKAGETVSKRLAF